MIFIGLFCTFLWVDEGEWNYILGGWGSVENYVGYWWWVGVSGGIFWVGGVGQTFFMGGWGWLLMAGGILNVAQGGWTVFMDRWGWVGVYFGWVGMDGGEQGRME